MAQCLVLYRRSLEFANTASKPNEQAFGNFNRALEDYIKKLPEGKKQLKFIDLCRNTCAASPAAINKLILDEEANRKRTLSRPVKRLFDRIINALKDYTDVIGQMGTSITPCIRRGRGF